jgi:hypothetical protein
MLKLLYFCVQYNRRIFVLYFHHSTNPRREILYPRGGLGAGASRNRCESGQGSARRVGGQRDICGAHKMHLDYLKEQSRQMWDGCIF